MKNKKTFIEKIGVLPAIMLGIANIFLMIVLYLALSFYKII